MTNKGLSAGGRPAFGRAEALRGGLIGREALATRPIGKSKVDGKGKSHGRTSNDKFAAD
jgi:hypothetical protein